ncbi:MAG TPA: hypothetical protein PLE54_06020 [Burkholderiaceae bacterium]|nr:hypothetical protein [Burkholderiaceae bacterium]
MAPIAIVFLLLVAIFAVYAITSARRRVARGGPLMHPGNAPSAYVAANHWGSITLTDGSHYQVAAGNDASGWRVNDEVYYDGAKLYNRTQRDYVIASKR